MGRPETEAAFRLRMFERDGNACTHCGRTERLEIHHIEPVSQRPDLWRDEPNIRTLCYWCHRAFHGKIKISPRKFMRPKHPLSGERRLEEVRKSLGLKREEIMYKLDISMSTVIRAEKGTGTAVVALAYSNYLKEKAKGRADLDTSIGYLCPDLKDKE